ncbi:hypothetical protein GOP47_0004024 [Adiantum capillus-veneris]|uniref:Uncharacterized protein n=1 Tax=Adiantum capillus-veneris TaxID=13818 RepID=A0A9D4V7U9_ADICA|nr:hypothetical protein GOP47_0004024 [Adiantum capillus-veneris]
MSCLYFLSEKPLVQCGEQPKKELRVAERHAWEKKLVVNCAERRREAPVHDLLTLRKTWGQVVDMPRLKTKPKLGLI